MLRFLSDYQLRWWILPIEERACRKTRLDGGCYPLNTSALPPRIRAVIADTALIPFLRYRTLELAYYLFFFIKYEDD